MLRCCMCRACRSGPGLRLRLPPATARSISPNGIRPTSASSMRARQLPAFARSRLRQRQVRQSEAGPPHDPTPERLMKDVFGRLATDFLSTIVFLVIYLATDSVVLATSVAIAGALGQVIYSRIRGVPLAFMTYASLALVIVLGSATLLTHDPRFVLAKPSIAHFAIGAIMLKRGWMLRYVPPIVVDTIPEYVTVAGFAWAVLMFALGAGTIAVAITGDIKLWALYVSVIAVGAEIAAFLVQYVAFRILVIG